MSLSILKFNKLSTGFEPVISSLPMKCLTPGPREQNGCMMLDNYDAKCTFLASNVRLNNIDIITGDDKLWMER